MLKRIGNYFRFRYTDVLIVIFIIVTFIFAIIFKGFVYNNEIKNSIGRLRQVIEQKAIIFNEIFDYMENYMVMIGDIVSLNDDNDSIEYFLDKYKNQQGFEYIKYVNKDGIGIDNNGNYVDLSDKEYFKKALNGDVCIQNIRTHDNSCSDVKTVISVPIIDNDSDIVGVMTGYFRNLDLKFFDDIKNISDDKITIIFNENNCPIYKSASFKTEKEFRDLVNFMRSDKINLIANNIKNLESNILEFKDKENTIFLYYMPLNITDWYIIISLPEMYITEQISLINSATNKLLIRTSIFAVCIFIIIIYLIKSINSKLLVISNKLKISEETFKISVNHLNKTIFEYDLNDDIINIIELNCFKSMPKTIKNVPQFIFDSDILKKKDKEVLIKSINDIKSGCKKITFINSVEFNNNILWAKTDIINVFDQNGNIKNSIGIIEDITAKKNLEELYIKEKNFKKVMTQENILMVEVDMDNDTFVTDINPYNEDFNNNKSFSDFVNIIEKKYIFEEDIDMFRNIINSNKSIKNVEIRVILNNNCIWVSIVKNVIVNSYYDINRCFYYIKNIDKTKQKTIQLRREAEIDQLTDILNRKTVEKRIKNNIGLSPDNEGVLIILDVDKFKFVNDTYGHSVGDEVLKITASRIKSIFRKNDIVGRLGGDEFVIFVNSIYDIDVIKEKTRILSEPYKYIVGDIEITLTLSIGISRFPDDANTYEGLYKKSDQALYTSKNLGRGRYTFYSQ